jgi:Domain of unknown function (DUF4352)
MSVQLPEPPSSQQPPQAPRNPYADAKAAKAYAKAMRPWWKKKRFIIPLGLVTLSILGSAAGSSDTGNNAGGDSAGSDTANVSGASTSTKRDKPAKSHSDGKSGSVGQSLTNAGTTYKVTSVRTADKIGDPDLLGARADGTFVIVSLNLTNNKDETKTFTDSSAKLKTSDGKEYETSDKAVLSFGDESLLLKDIQPDLTTRGKLAFDVPSSKLSGSKLVVEDLFGSGEIKVDLGL